MKIATALLVLLFATPARAQEAIYLDDRSSPESVISSYYNAISRAEYARAYSYFGADFAPGYDRWAEGYADTSQVEVSFGRPAQEGAAGSIYWTLPVRLDVTTVDARDSYFTGCYTLRLSQPANQSPPFQPLHIVSGNLREVDAQGFAPAVCSVP